MAGDVRIAVTCGEPAGIGAEVALKALAQGVSGADAVLVGPAEVWAAAGTVAGVDPGRWPCHPVEMPAEPDWGWGRPTLRSAQVAVRAVEAGVELVRAGRVDAVVTAPLTKEGLRATGHPYPGHTELLQALCGGEALMMLAGPRLRVVLVTTHLPLCRVPPAVTRTAVLRAVWGAHQGLRRDLGIPAPRIGVAALNPHAGEGGVLGEEEGREIAPAVEQARAEGIGAEGPVPADVLFHRAAAGAFDVVVAMYHDQGLGPLKLLHFDEAVNVTLGLPIVRTSPDHGTAFDIAGTGRASPTSFRAALRTAAEIARRRRG